MTAAIIPFPSPAPAVPGQALDQANVQGLETGEASATVANALVFAQLVEALLGDNSLISQEVPQAAPEGTEAAATTDDLKSTTGDETSTTCARPELVLSTLVVLPTPVPVAVPAPAPITVPKVEQMVEPSPDLEMDAAETGILTVEDAPAPSASFFGGDETTVTRVAPKSDTDTGDDTETEAPTVPVREAASQPQMTAVQAAPVTELPVPVELPQAAPTAEARTPAPQPQIAPAQTETASTPVTPDRVETVARRQTNSQPLAFSLRLSRREQDTSVEPPTATVGESEAPAESLITTTTEAETPEVKVPTRTFAVASPRQAPLAQTPTEKATVATDQAASRTESTQTPTRSTPDVELKAAPTVRPPKAQPAAETSAPAKEPVKAATEIHHADTRPATPVTVAAPNADTQPAPSKSGQLPAARTETVETVSGKRIDTVQPRTARDIVVQIPVEASRKVEVQVAEKAGEVRVAVHTADPELSQSLRVELGSLVSRLESAGYRAESLAPTESFVSSSSSARQDPSSSQQEASRGFSGQGQGSAGQGSNGQRRQQNDGTPWAEQFASSLAPEQETGQESTPWQSIFNR